jgi:hypothetical protein
MAGISRNQEGLFLNGAGIGMPCQGGKTPAGFWHEDRGTRSHTVKKMAVLPQTPGKKSREILPQCRKACVPHNPAAVRLNKKNTGYNQKTDRVTRFSSLPGTTVFC